MEIKVNINESCKNCKRSLIYFKTLQKKHKKYYANMNMKDYTLINSICLAPDYNCSGHLTHFHIEKASKEFLKMMIKGIENSEKESKKIMEFKKKQLNKQRKK
jgi:hypothetical protein